MTFKEDFPSLSKVIPFPEDYDKLSSYVEYIVTKYCKDNQRLLEAKESLLNKLSYVEGGWCNDEIKEYVDEWYKELGL